MALSGDAIFTLVVLLCMFVALFFEVRSPEMIVFTSLIIVWTAGVISTQDALSGFSNEGMITVGALFIVVKAVERSGLVDRVARRVFGTNTSKWSGLLRLQLLTFSLSGIFNNTPLVALLMPITRDWARARSFAPSQFLIPLSFSSIAGGLTTEIGTSTNLVVQGALRDEGLQTFTFFEPALLGIPLGLLLIAYSCTVGQRLLPKDRGGMFRLVRDRAKDLITEIRVDASCALSGQPVEKFLNKIGVNKNALLKIRRPVAGVASGAPASSAAGETRMSDGGALPMKRRRSREDVPAPASVGPGRLRSNSDSSGSLTMPPMMLPEAASVDDGPLSMDAKDVHYDGPIAPVPRRVHLRSQMPPGVGGLGLSPPSAADLQALKFAALVAKETPRRSVSPLPLPRNLSFFRREYAEGRPMDIGYVFRTGHLWGRSGRKRAAEETKDTSAGGRVVAHTDPMEATGLMHSDGALARAARAPLDIESAGASEEKAEDVQSTSSMRRRRRRLGSPSSHPQHAFTFPHPGARPDLERSKEMQLFGPDSIFRRQPAAPGEGPVAPASPDLRAAKEQLRRMDAQLPRHLLRRKKKYRAAESKEEYMPDSPDSQGLAPYVDIVPVPDGEAVQAGDVVFLSVGAHALAHFTELAPIKGLKLLDVDVLDMSGFGTELAELIISDENPYVGYRLGRVKEDFQKRYSVSIVALRRRGADPGAVHQAADASTQDLPLAAGDTVLVNAFQDTLDTLQDDDVAKDFFLVTRVGSIPTPVSWYDYVPVFIFLGMLLCVSVPSFVPGAAFKVEISQASMVTVAVLVGGNWVSSKEAINFVDFKLLALIGSALGLSRAVTASGLAQSVAGSIANSGLDKTGTLFLLYGFTVVMTELVTNNAAAALAVPIATQLARDLNVSHMPFAAAVMFAASTAFATPVGYQTNTMVWGPGGYRFSDFIKVGLPIDLLFTIVSVFMIPLIWPFDDVPDQDGGA